MPPARNVLVDNTYHNFIFLQRGHPPLYTFAGSYYVPGPRLPGPPTPGRGRARRASGWRDPMPGAVRLESFNAVAILT